MNQNRKPGKTTLVILSIICIALITISIVGSRTVSPITGFTGMIITPIQKGMNRLGSFLAGFSDNMTDAAALREENAKLQEQVDSLTAENSKLVLNKEELNRLQGLLELKEQYTDYDTVGAHVISKGSGNWFTTFTIDKGSNDGIQPDCNVMAGAGLCGIVTDVGPNWARVRSITDDDSNVSAMVSTTSDTCIVAGNLQLIDEGTLSLVKLTDDNNHVHVGDKVVTSNISEKFLPGILIGYISELNNDANNLTKSGTVNPAVDFRHLQEVLVIRTLKEYIPSEGSVPESDDQSDENATTLTAPRAEDVAAAAEQAAENGENAQAAADGAAVDAASQENAGDGAADQAAADGAEAAAAEGAVEGAAAAEGTADGAAQAAAAEGTADGAAQAAAAEGTADGAAQAAVAEGTAQAAAADGAAQAQDAQAAEGGEQ